MPRLPAAALIAATLLATPALAENYRGRDLLADCADLREFSAATVILAGLEKAFPCR
jgi:hypothetical protein